MSNGNCTVKNEAESFLQLKLTVPQRGVELELELPAGSHTALIGQNGAGKSTVLQAITGTIGAEKLVVAGKDLTKVPVHQRNIAYVGQKPVLFKHLNVLNNVVYGLRARGVTKNEARLQGLDMLERLEISDLAKRKVQTLSGGQAQKVALARALVAKPQLLLLDEPFAALDVNASSQIRKILNELCQELPLLLVTHDLLDLLTITDSVASICQGKLIQQASIEEFLEIPIGGFAASLTAKTWVPVKLQSQNQLLTEQGVQIDLEQGFAAIVSEQARSSSPGNGAEYLALIDPAYISLATGITDNARAQQLQSELQAQLQLSDPQQLGHKIVRYLGEVPLVSENVPGNVTTLGSVKVSNRMKLIHTSFD